MSDALSRFGITGFLPTLTATDAATTLRAAEAVRASLSQNSQAVLGLNLEGPFINASKAGMADADACRPFDVEFVRDVVEEIAPGKLYMTAAPENFDDNVETAGAILSIGHTTATYEETCAFFQSGVGVATHMFNAMTGVSGREPGVAGAILDSTATRASLIADGYHVHPATARLAFTRLGDARLFLISDGMPPIGSEITTFTYGSHLVTASSGRCTTEDGVLAGTAVDLGQAARNLAGWLDDDVATVVPLITSVPAAVLGIDAEYGAIKPGAVANLVVTDYALNVEQTIVRGDLDSLEQK